mmetsp:Transcript_55480/g.168666  ORF Transcript_55480/g.168666 Transcript_55480/m.168666 type:complete len:217 (-) Transcript_55480:3371-4021(-)
MYGAEVLPSTSLAQMPSSSGMTCDTMKSSPVHNFTPQCSNMGFVCAVGQARRAIRGKVSLHSALECLSAGSTQQCVVSFASRAFNATNLEFLGSAVLNSGSLATSSRSMPPLTARTEKYASNSCLCAPDNASTSLVSWHSNWIMPLFDVTNKGVMMRAMRSSASSSACSVATPHCLKMPDKLATTSGSCAICVTATTEPAECKGTMPSPFSPSPSQ